MQDEPLLSLMRLMADGDWPAVSQSIHAHPDLATAALERGATREDATAYFLSAISHHVYLGDTALHVGAAAYGVVIVDELVTLGADIEAENRRGARPLHYAVDGGPGSDWWDPIAQGQTVTALLTLGADPNAVDRNGTTPLLRAVRNRGANAVEALLAGGADPAATNGRGSTALQLARTTSGRGGSGTVQAKAEQERIIEVLAAANRS